jgi:hypothetical protein
MAILSTNPYVPAQYLYPKKRDELVVRMNGGPNSIANCPGQYSLQVAQFSGRSTFDPKDEQFKGMAFLRNSPLATAADDAEKLAAKLASDPDVRKLGQPVYVYHDRTSSRVFMGSFNVDRDEKAAAMRDELLKLAVPLLDSKRPGGATDSMIVPASALTDLTEIKTELQ